MTAEDAGPSGPPELLLSQSRRGERTLPRLLPHGCSGFWRGTQTRRRWPEAEPALHRRSARRLVQRMEAVRIWEPQAGSYRTWADPALFRGSICQPNFPIWTGATATETMPRSEEDETELVLTPGMVGMGGLDYDFEGPSQAAGPHPGFTPSDRPGDPAAYPICGACEFRLLQPRAAVQPPAAPASGDQAGQSQRGAAKSECSGRCPGLTR
jgi:hypothetical protein